jgi:hypothetical protein
VRRHFGCEKAHAVMVENRHFAERVTLQMLGRFRGGRRLACGKLRATRPTEQERSCSFAL